MSLQRTSGYPKKHLSCLRVSTIHQTGSCCVLLIWRSSYRVLVALQFEADGWNGCSLLHPEFTNRECSCGTWECLVSPQPRGSDSCSSGFPSEYHNPQASRCSGRKISHPLWWNLVRPVVAEDTYLVTPVLPKLNPSHDLLVNEIGGHIILARVVPRSEDLLPEEEPPRCIALLRPLFFGVLLALRHSIHHMVIAAPQRGHLVRAEGNVAFTGLNADLSR